MSTLNHPAISDSCVMQKYPNARNNERKALLSLVSLTPGVSIVDVQAAGGYLSDGVNALLQGNVDLICIEPESSLSQRLNHSYRVVEDNIEHWPSIESESVDIVLGLAGLHHSNDQQATINEAFRVLKPCGYFAICDVIDDSDIANWLNNYVHQHNQSGHIGDFLTPGEISTMMSDAGFNDIHESIKDVPWVFLYDLDVPTFFKGLFGLKNDINQIKKAIPNYFNLHKKFNCTEVPWQLIYAVAQKPG
ncbi:MAG: hypothetical protein COB22_04340 [Cycloclasticus sp.]|nr:MAG: hypothetical protein COB22_04340 [Cycloclasticus sp.]